jgi:ubiquinone/menaquinone biosynthesis C-methylase UbiE
MELQEMARQQEPPLFEPHGFHLVEATRIRDSSRMWAMQREAPSSIPLGRTKTPYRTNTSKIPTAPVEQHTKVVAGDGIMQKTKSPEQLRLESARIYEQRIVPILFEPWGRRLLEDVPIQQAQHLLDVACGSGAVSRLAALKVGPKGSITGLDLNDGMIEAARDSCKDMVPPIDLHLGDATDMPFEDDRFDGVFCQQGIQFIPDKQAAVDQMHRVLRPGGWLGLTQWRSQEHVPGFRILIEALEAHIDPVAAQVMRTPFSGPGIDELRQLVQDAGFTKARVLYQTGTIRYPSAEEFTRLSIDATPPGPKGHLKAMIENVDQRDQDKLFKEVERGLAEYTDDEGVVFPMTTHLVVATK